MSACYVRELDHQFWLSQRVKERYQEVYRLCAAKPKQRVRYLEAYSLRRWMWEHYENQLKKRLFWHEWEIERVYQEQMELMSLKDRKLVSEMDPDERKWLQVLILAERFRRRIEWVESCHL
jgi:hypothetical protein